MTYRERREGRAARLAEWAEKRKAKAADLVERNEPYRGDVAFNTQPGRIVERERANRRNEKAWEHTTKARSMSERSENIERQLRDSIYSDDPDAVEALEERIARLEAQRDENKAKNREITKALKGASDEEIPARLAAIGASDALSPMWRPGVGRWAIGYEVKNLTADIGRNRKRLEHLKRKRDAS